MKEEKFDFESYKREAVRKLLSKEPGMSIDKLTKPLLKQILEAALEGEMDAHMERERDIGNRTERRLFAYVQSRIMLLAFYSFLPLLVFSLAWAKVAAAFVGVSPRLVLSPTEKTLMMIASAFVGISASPLLGVITNKKCVDGN